MVIEQHVLMYNMTLTTGSDLAKRIDIVLRCVRIKFKKPGCKKNASGYEVTAEVQSEMKDSRKLIVNRCIFI